MCSELDDGATEWGGRPVARRVVTAGPRQRVVLRGIVRGVRVRGGPRSVAEAATSVGQASQGTWFEADLDDGSGQVTLRWTGRLDIPGVEPGVGLRIRGTVLGEGERMVILDPRYEFA